MKIFKSFENSNYECNAYIERGITAFCRYGMAVDTGKELLAETHAMWNESSLALEGILPKEAIPYCH